MFHPFDAASYALPKTHVRFQVSDPKLQALYEKAEHACLENIVTYNGKSFLREGGGYQNLWLETQPMGGAMYACRNPVVGLNNILLFMQYQRRDGRIPGMLFFRPERGLSACYDWFQGFCFPQPAMQLAAYLHHDPIYLHMLYDALRDFDTYLRTYRMNENGDFYRWCCWDTAEDNLSLLLENSGKDGYYGGEIAPVTTGRDMPWTCMEMYGWSYCANVTLASIANLLHLEEAPLLEERALQVQKRLKEHLWDEDRAACFEKDSHGDVLSCLSHENLRCMYYGVFTQQMADRFVHAHLLNPDDFLTPLPLPSIAISDPWYRNLPDNNWSGPVQGLTWQRLILALQNYGYHAELASLGYRWLQHLKTTEKLTQQYDAITGEPGKGPDGYGPTCLSALEYMALLYGIHVESDSLAFTWMRDNLEGSYEQVLGAHTYQMVATPNEMIGFVDGTECFRASKGLKIITDMQGHILRVIPVHTRVFSGSIQSKAQYFEGLCTTNQEITLT